MRWKNSRSRLAWLPLVLLMMIPTVAPAAWVSFTGSFSTTDIPDGTGELTSDLTVSGIPNLPVTGANVRIRLIGLYHSWSGDLEVTVQNVLNGITETVFSQICNPPEAFGCSANFDTSFADYVFQAGGAHNLWTAALALGDVEPIANADLDPGSGLIVPRVFAGSNSGSSADNNLFISLNGLNPNGQWTITVRDLATGETGSIQGWGVDVWVNEVPEPANAALVVAGLGMLWLRRRRA